MDAEYAFSRRSAPAAEPPNRFSGPMSLAMRRCAPRGQPNPTKICHRGRMGRIAHNRAYTRACVCVRTRVRTPAHLSPGAENPCGREKRHRPYRELYKPQLH
jgi:hypothetical protein